MLFYPYSSQNDYFDREYGHEVLQATTAHVN